MTMKLYTCRGKHTGRTYYGTGHSLNQAAREIGVKPSHLILLRSEKMPLQIVTEEPQLNSPLEDGRVERP